MGAGYDAIALVDGEVEIGRLRRHRLRRIEFEEERARADRRWLAPSWLPPRRNPKSSSTWPAFQARSKRADNLRGGASQPNHRGSATSAWHPRILRLRD